MKEYFYWIFREFGWRGSLAHLGIMATELSTYFAQNLAKKVFILEA